MASSFRNLYRSLVPSWLNDGGDGSRVLHSLSMLLDASAERLTQSLTARFPTRAPLDALPMLGRDRGIPRGIGEASATYAARLLKWRYPRGHRVRGNDFALLDQILALLPMTSAAHTIGASGATCQLTRAGAETYTPTGAWTWDSRPGTDWSRFWLRLDGVAPQYSTDDGRFGDAEPQTLGLRGVTSEQVRSVRGLLYGAVPWRPAGTLPEWLICTSSSGQTVTPNARWVLPWRILSGVAVPTRDPALAFIPLRADHDTYMGDPDLFAAGVDQERDPSLPDGTAPVPDPVTTGDPTSFPVTAPADHPGDPAMFPLAFPLPHDGSSV